MTNASAVSEPPVSRDLEASPKVLRLPAGLYSFTVRDGHGGPLTEELAAPALQVGLAPVRSAGTVEFLAGAATLDRWLTRSGDIMMVRISGGDASLLLTSVRWPDSPPLAVDIQRLESPQVAGIEEARAAPARILAHIRNFGDVHFNGGWAGFPGGKLWIEAFAVASAGDAGPDLIEYRGITADGFETPWLSNQILCGSRGRGMPLTGFAVRVRKDATQYYDCAYTGRFASGATIGPVRDGVMCHSSVPGDPLEALDVRVAALDVRARAAGGLE